MELDTDLYKHNYEGCEVLDGFDSAQALARYRSGLLEKSRSEAAFIERHVAVERPMRVLELCCGNGRLLMALAARRRLELGLGIEISTDRVRFAQQWIADAAERTVRVVRGDVLRGLDADAARFDLAVCLSGAFGYFRVTDPSAPRRVLDELRARLAPGGFLLLELFQLTDSFRALLDAGDGPARTWRPLPDTDPFAYQLDEFEYSRTARVLRREKIFVRRDGAIDAGRTELVADHTPDEIEALAREAGFRAVSSHADFDDAAFVAGAASRLVLLLRADG